MAAARIDKQGVPAHILGPRLILMLSVLALTLFGFVMIYSTSSVITLASASADTVGVVDPMADTLKQIAFAAIGIGCAFVVRKFVPYSIWRNDLILLLMWLVAFLLLVLTMVSGAGQDEWGAQRWLVLGPVSLQPSEVAKIALLLVAARLFDDFRVERLSIGQLGVLLFGGVLLPLLIILVAQSDLGTTMICVMGVLAVMWLGEVPSRTMAGVVAMVVLLGSLSIVTSEYRFERLMVFQHPWDDGQGGYGNGYQIIHSWYALAGGGLFGVGLGSSHEKYLYLTQSDTDFIFAIIGEELGLAGALVVIILFLLVLWAGMHIARTAPDNFGTMVAGGCTIMIVFQAFLNIAMVIGLFPVVGKPLPFISSGGSSLIATFIMVGLILSVSQGAVDNSLAPARRRADLRIVRADSNGSRSGGNRKSVVSGGGGRTSKRRLGRNQAARAEVSVGPERTGKRGGVTSAAPSGSIGWDALSLRARRGSNTNTRQLNLSGASVRKGRR